MSLESTSCQGALIRVPRSDEDQENKNAEYVFQKKGGTERSYNFLHELDLRKGHHNSIGNPFQPQQPGESDRTREPLHSLALKTSSLLELVSLVDAV